MQRETEDEEQEKTLKGRVMKNVLMRADSSGVLSSTHTLYLNTHTHTHTHRTLPPPPGILSAELER